MVPQDRFAPSSNGQSLGNPLSSSNPDELLAQFKRIEDAWKKAEDKLAQTHVPIDVKIMVNDGTIEDEQYGTVGETARYLGYHKIKGSRRVCVIDYSLHYSGGEYDEVTPITECPVDERLEMFDHFQKLYDHAKAIAGSYVPKIKERVDKFEQSLAFTDLF